MTKSTALARSVRTFIAVLAGYASGWAVINWATDWKTGAALVTLNVLAALLAGVIAYLTGLSDSWRARVTSPFYRAAATGLQAIAAGLATLGIAELTTEEFFNFGQAAVRIIAGAVAAFAVNYFQNAAEDKQVA